MNPGEPTTLDWIVISIPAVVVVVGTIVVAIIEIVQNWGDWK